MNKTRGGDGIPVELFQLLKDDAVKVLHSICQQIWKTQQWPQDWKRSVFIPIPKKGGAKECSNCSTIALISHASKVMLKILQIRLQQNVNRELPDVEAGVRKGRGTRDQIANIHWIIEKARQTQKNIYFCYIDYAIFAKLIFAKHSNSYNNAIMPCFIHLFPTYDILFWITLLQVCQRTGIMATTSTCMHAKSLQSHLTLHEPVDSSLQDSFVHIILLARIQEWVAMPFTSILGWIFPT